MYLTLKRLEAPESGGIWQSVGVGLGTSSCTWKGQRGRRYGMRNSQRAVLEGDNDWTVRKRLKNNKNMQNRKYRWFSFLIFRISASLQKDLYKNQQLYSTMMLCRYMLLQSFLFFSFLLFLLLFLLLYFLFLGFEKESLYTVLTHSVDQADLELTQF